MGIDDPGDGHPAAGELLDYQGVGQQRFAEAAVLFGDRQAEQAHVLHSRHDRVGNSSACSSAVAFGMISLSMKVRVTVVIHKGMIPAQSR